MKNTVFHIFALLFACVLLASCQREEPPEPIDLGAHLPAAPGMNVLVVSFDALRADGLGLYGYSREVSPNLDAFAAESLVFENAYSAAPVTPTSFAAAFTGLYPFKVFVGWQLIPAATLAEVMRAAGYRTFALLNNAQLIVERNFDIGFDHYETGPWKDENLAEEAIAQLDEALQDERPFFGWVHFISPHTPYTYRDVSAHIAPRLDEGRFAESVGGSFEIHSDEELARARDLYDGEVFFADYLFGQLMAYLDDRGVLDNTIVVVTADHGEEFMDHGQVQHNALYEELVRVPLLLRHPGNLAGARTDAPASTMDLLPTLAALVGAEAPDALDGINLAAPVSPERHRIVTSMTNARRYEILSERGGKKLIQICTPEFTEELYVLDDDPGEKNNIVLDNPDLANELGGRLEGALRTEPCALIRAANQGKAPEDLLSPEQIEELKSLGYIQ